MSAMPTEAIPTSVRFSKTTNQEIDAAKKAINRKTKMSRAAVIDLAVQRGIPVLLKALGIEGTR